MGAPKNVHFDVYEGVKELRAHLMSDSKICITVLRRSEILASPFNKRLKTLHHNVTNVKKKHVHLHCASASNNCITSL